MSNEEFTSFLISQINEKDKQISRLSEIITRDIEIMKLEHELLLSAYKEISKLINK